MTAIAKFFLFFSSWAPVYATMALVAYATAPRISCVLAVVTVLAIAMYFFMEWVIFEGSEKSYLIEDVTKRDENVIMYVIAYLPPFFAVSYIDVGSLLALLLFYVLFAITYVKLDLYYLNPMFVFMSFRAYTIKSDGREYVALVKNGYIPPIGQIIHARGHDNVLIIDRR
jgi:hypothetical protein